MVPASEAYSEPCEASKMEVFAKIINCFQLLMTCFLGGFLRQKQPPGYSIKKGVLKNFVNFTRKPLCQSYFIKKEAVAQMFSCEFSEIFKNTFFTEHFRATSSVNTSLRFSYNRNTRRDIWSNEKTVDV